MLWKRYIHCLSEFRKRSTRTDEIDYIFLYDLITSDLNKKKYLMKRLCIYFSTFAKLTDVFASSKCTASFRMRTLALFRLLKIATAVWYGENERKQLWWKWHYNDTFPWNKYVFWRSNKYMFTWLSNFDIVYHLLL